MRIAAPLFAAVLGVGMLPPAGAAFAQECTCQVPLTTEVVGQILNASGDVRIAQATNFTRASTGAELEGGTRLIVGRGSALVRLGEECQISLGENSSLTLIPRGEVLCAAVETGQTAAYDNVGTALGVAGAALLVVGGAVLITQQEDDDAPPVSVE